MPLTEPYLASSVSSRLVIPLHLLNEQDVEIVGNKATNLGKMMRAGLPVPSGFCLTTQAFQLWIRNSPAVEEALRELSQLDRADWEGLRKRAAQLRSLLEGTPVPEPIVRAVVSACESDTMVSELATKPTELADASGLATRVPLRWGLAVRSSATVEDLPNASFAGQHDSILNVKGREALLEAIRSCWLSLFSERAVLYRAHNGLGQRRVAMAVIVQKMVKPETAGVLFTVNPITGDINQVVIEAVAGLGEDLVSGKAKPERFTVDKEGLRVFSREPSSEKIETGGKYNGEATPNPNKPLLEDGALQNLVALAQSVEELFGKSQDIEWAMQDGQVWLLQARPVTTLGGTTPIHGTVWTRANICENLPDVVTPMAWSVMDSVLIGCFKPIFRIIGRDLETQPWIALIHGRAYLSLSLSEDLLGGFRLLNKLDVHELLGGHAPEETAISQTPKRRKPSLNELVFGSMVGLHVAVNLVHPTGKTFLDRLRQRISALTQRDLSAVPGYELVELIREIGPKTFPELNNPITTARLMGYVGSGLASSVNVLLLCRRWLDDQSGSLGRLLLSGAKDMASAESGWELERLADWVRGNPRVAQAIQETPKFEALRGVLKGSEEGSQFFALWDAFMARHGHHGRGEMDVYNPRWSETPDYVLDLLRSYLTASQRKANGRSDPDRVLADCLKPLRNPLKKWLLKLFVARGRAGLAYRENIKSEAVRVFAFVRRVLLEAGSRLQREDVLAQPEDVFFLNLEELEELLSRKVQLDVSNIVAERRTEHLRLQTLDAPVIVTGSSLPGRSSRNGALKKSAAGAVQLEGLPVSPGVATGRARVILRADTQTRVLPGEVLIAPFTDPGWTPYFLNAAAIVVDIGGQLSHGSIIAREYGIPAVVNV
ncbi:MAG TPA: PEP/pyruvate-binding domain-containing protein, partial [Clostridia bacterium]|nr:PEP/pyruvate-binding domain-containing protein [Clostridia bacterium]